MIDAAHARSDEHLEAPPPNATAVVRAELSRGLEAELARLAPIDMRRRCAELLTFGGGYALGVAAIVLGRTAPAGSAAVAACVLGTIVAAFASNALVLLLHEGMHGVLLPSARWNRWISFLCGVPIAMSFSAYRVLHLRHHRYLGDPRDPDDYHNYSGSRFWIWVLHYVRLLAGSFLYLVLIPLFGWKYGTRLERRQIAQEYALLAVIAMVAIALVPGELLLWAWFVPAVIVGYMINLRGFAQHGLTEARDPLLASRSLLPARITRFLLLNENLHLEHHLFPEVPSHHLPALRALLAPRYPREIVGRSYAGVIGRFLLCSMRGDESPLGVVTHDEGGPPS